MRSLKNKKNYKARLRGEFMDVLGRSSSSSRFFQSLNLKAWTLSIWMHQDLELGSHTVPDIIFLQEAYKWFQNKVMALAFKHKMCAHLIRAGV